MCKILVIDDDREIRELVKELLMELPYQVEIALAETGYEGLEKIRKILPDLILLDIYLPDIDGLSVCRQLKQDASLKNIPVLMMTGVNTDHDWLKSALKAGAESFVNKPFHPHYLLAQVNTMLRLKQAEDRLRNQNLLLEQRLMERSQELVESEQLFFSFMHEIQALVYIKNAEGKYLFINTYFKKLFQNRQWVGIRDEDIFSPDEAALMSRYDDIAKETGSCIYEQTLTLGDKAVIIENHKFRIQRSNGEVFVGGVAFDITQRRNAQDLVESSLREKEILLKEVHHRVKNNMQVISSLLRMQSTFIKNDTDRQLFIDSLNRVRSMALIHERLYKNDNLSQIDLDIYVRQLLQQLGAMYIRADLQVAAEIDIEDIPLDLDTAIPLGLIINEIVSNAYKYAFEGRVRGLITISMKRQENCLEVKIGDDGIGLDPSLTLDDGNLGFQLISSLTAQLHGKITISRDNGTIFTLRFCLPQSE